MMEFKFFQKGMVKIYYPSHIPDEFKNVYCQGWISRKNGISSNECVYMIKIYRRCWMAGWVNAGISRS